MGMSAAEVVARHRTHIARHGAVVYVIFPDAGAAAEFGQQLSCEVAEIPGGATRLVRTLSPQEGPEPHRAILELIDGDSRAHRFFVSVEDLKAFATIPIVARANEALARSDASEWSAPVHYRETDPEADRIMLANLKARLFRAESALTIQRRQIKTIMATYVERAHLPASRYPSYCCQRYGEQVGWIGRAFQAIGVPLHACRAERGEA